MFSSFLPSGQLCQGLLPGEQSQKQTAEEFAGSSFPDAERTASSLRGHLTCAVTQGQ